MEELKAKNSTIFFGKFNKEDEACKKLLKKLGLVNNKENRKKVSNKFHYKVSDAFIYILIRYNMSTLFVIFGSNVKWINGKTFAFMFPTV